MSLPWLREPWRQISRDYQQGSLAHAHCLPWQADLGIAQFVEEWIKLLLCNEPNGRACGKCKSCLLYQAKTHPDYYQVASIDGKAISVDQIRELLTKLQQTPNQAGAKVVWLHDAEKMSVTAANALLKTLEEPTQSTYFIVTPERSERLLPTLRSRMRLHRLPQPDAELLEQWLAQQLQRVLRADEQQLIRNYPQRPLALLKWLQSGEYPTHQLSELAQALLGQQAWPTLAKDNWQSWLLASEQLLQELMRVWQNLPQEHLLLANQQQALQDWLRQHNLCMTKLNEQLHLCYAMRQQVAEQSGLNGPLLLQELWMRWH
ncbi:hypothetical protein IDAT_00790 [Pseudidiomarina atlantica]|jgi:DNA polymerase-3 subunit delta'|uniref:DNA-directed DNA polymerase n=1 Tax=Pseudidiomarina atlantica TaxID=1517416 RepID=A0A094IPR5_9GAMM|nr:DNA polymerase III subunit delta' [Pseudidiomarina atlantica]KFZ29675.1 hypothetical protein IDAT_00790 [Pseudidiomarina atlantica]